MYLGGGQHQTQKTKLKVHKCKNQNKNHPQHKGSKCKLVKKKNIIVNYYMCLNSRYECTLFLMFWLYYKHTHTHKKYLANLVVTPNVKPSI